MVITVWGKMEDIITYVKHLDEKVDVEKILVHCCRRNRCILYE